MSGEGALLASLGDVEAPIFPRSTLKPFQALASRSAGAELHGERLAIAQAFAGPPGGGRVAGQFAGRQR